MGWSQRGPQAEKPLGSLSRVLRLKSSILREVILTFVERIETKGQELGKHSCSGCRAAFHDAGLEPQGLCS